MWRRTVKPVILTSATVSVRRTVPTNADRSAPCKRCSETGRSWPAECTGGESRTSPAASSISKARMRRAGGQLRAMMGSRAARRSLYRRLPPERHDQHVAVRGVGRVKRLHGGNAMEDAVIVH